MCLVVVAQGVHPDFPFILVANRDEFHDRPSLPMHWWQSPGDVLAGKDELGGGTWLALNKAGDIAVVTNFRENPPFTGPKSRGELPLKFVESEQSGNALGQNLPVSEYSGFNLLVRRAHGPSIVVRNRPDEAVEEIHSKCFAVSNGPLADEWPKMRRTTQRVSELVTSDKVSEADLLDVLADNNQADHSELPNTGIAADMEKFLSSPFIISERYGTRASTIVWLGHTEARVVEYGFGRDGRQTGRVAFQWRLA